MSEHLPIVQLIARRIHERLPRHVPLEDLYSAGVVGYPCVAFTLSYFLFTGHAAPESSSQRASPLPHPVRFPGGGSLA